MSKYKNIPSILKREGRWCLWKRETINGRKTKVPYTTRGTRARSNNPNDFSDYNQVITKVERFDGLGLGLFGDIAALDIDHCIEKDIVSPLAQDIINTLNSYTEISPSGSGIRIIIKVNKGFKYDKARYLIMNSKLGLEVYVSGSTSKYVSITGNATNGNDVEERTSELCSILEKYMKRSQAKTVNSEIKNGETILSDRKVVAKACEAKNGKIFHDMYYDGKHSYKSQSEADLAFLSMLSFWTNKNVEQMDRLYRSSAMYRQKWERQDYRENTMLKAISGCKETYNPIRIPAINEFDVTYQKVLQMDPYHNPKYKPSDIGFGLLLADIIADTARFVPERKMWYVYDGVRWNPDIGNLVTMEKAKRLANAFLKYAAIDLEDCDNIKKYINEVTKWQSRRNRETYLKEAQSVYPVSIEKFDSDKYLLNLNNGTLDLNSFRFREHRFDDMITKLAPVDYNPSSFCERWNSFITQFMSEDTAKQRFLQKCLGLCITGNTDNECLFIFYGNTTRNGKGTLVESVLRVTGDYGKTVRPETIAQKTNVNSQAPSEDIARLKGVRFVNISEPSRNLVLNAAQVKSMTGNDSLNARMLNENSFDFHPEFTICINTNYLPVVTDMTLFTSGRIVIVPFERHFTEEEQDKTLKTEFAKPQAQSAILNWLVEGFRMVKEEGLCTPPSVKNATQDYYHESNKIGQFFDECMIPTPGAEEKTSAVYSEYQTWCSLNGCYAESLRNFNNEIRKTTQIVRRRPKGKEDKTTLILGYTLRSVAFPV